MAARTGNLPALLRHYGGFVLAGGVALVVDIAVLQTLTWLFAMSVFAARPFAIAIAMVVSWYINRTVTFRYQHPPSIAEFLRFAAVSWFAQFINYILFVAILVVRPPTHPVVAIVAASLVAMFVSYAGYRYGVFRNPRG